MGMPRVELVDLEDRTCWIEVDAGASVFGLRDAAAMRMGVPAEHLRLTCGGRELEDASFLCDESALLFPVRAMLRLLGGKGGFGAMLRTAGAKGIKTTDFDACRDLNGRRLRHVNAASRLREWEAKADERNLKKLEQKAAQAAARKGPDLPRFDDDEYEDMLEVQPPLTYVSTQSTINCTSLQHPALSFTSFPAVRI